MTPEHMKTTPEDIDLDRMKDDTISRQAVIDLLKQMRKDGDMVPWEGKDVFARIRKLPSAQPEPSEITDEQAILHLQSTGWMQNHDREMYESGLRERLADDSEDYNSLIPCGDTISRQAAIDALRNITAIVSPISDDVFLIDKAEAMTELMLLPSADVVPVVRCKDCKFREEDAFCTGRGFPCQLVPDDGFCDKGKKE